MGIDTPLAHKENEPPTSAGHAPCTALATRVPEGRKRWTFAKSQLSTEIVKILRK